MQFSKTFAAVFLLLSANLFAQDTKRDAAKYYFSPTEVTVLPSSIVNLNIVEFNQNDFDFGHHPLMVVNWTVNGHDLKNQNANEGHVDFSMSSTATYTAPAAPPKQDPVIVAATFLAADNPADTTAGSTKMTLLCRIHVYDAPNFFFISGSANTGTGGKLYSFKEPASITARHGAEVAADAGGEWSVHSSGLTERGDQATIRLIFNGASAGAYSWRMNVDDKGNITPPVVSAAVDVIGADGKPLSYASLQLPGSIVVKTFDTKTKLVRGYFNGPMMNAEKEIVFVSGGFTAYLR